MPEATNSAPVIPENIDAEIAKLLQYADAEDLQTLDELLSAAPKDIEGEIKKCKEDICYFVSTYLHVQDPRDQTLSRFILFPKQVECLKWMQQLYHTGKNGCIEKSRDSGATYLACAVSIHGWLFGVNSSYGFGSCKVDKIDKRGDQSCIFEKMRVMIQKLPDWMIKQCARGFDKRKHDKELLLINPSNNCTIIGEGGDNIGRGGRNTIYFVDEAAQIEHPDLVDAALSQNTNCRIDISTPFGVDNAFYKRKKLSQTFTLHWIDDPRKWHWKEISSNGTTIKTGTGRIDGVSLPTSTNPPVARKDGSTFIYPWYEIQREDESFRNNPSLLAQEVDIDYIGSGHPRFNRAFILDMKMKVHDGHKYMPGWEPDYIETPYDSAWYGTVTTFAQPEYGRKYILLADTAYGLTMSGKSDFSVAHVFDLESCEQVVHYRGQMSEYFFAEDIVNLARMYNDAILVVEIPGPGNAVISHAVNVLKYPYIYSSWDDDAFNQTPTTRYGWIRTQNSKMEADGDLASMLIEWERGFESILIRHPNTYEECAYYSKLKGNKTGAESGGHDDEVSCLTMLANVWGTYSTRGRMKTGAKRSFRPKLTNS